MARINQSELTKMERNRTPSTLLHLRCPSVYQTECVYGVGGIVKEMTRVYGWW